MHKVVPLRVLVADGNPSQLGILRDYVRQLADVELCASVNNASELLECLRQGAVVDVLILDEYLRGSSVLFLLERIAGLHLRHRPCIIVTLSRDNPQKREKLLDLGADEVLTKPYTLEDLFKNVFLCCVSKEAYLQKRMQERIAWHLNRLHICQARTGYWLLMLALEKLIQEQRLCSSTKELYPEIASKIGMTAKAVESGIRRVIDDARIANTTEYVQMCEFLKQSPETTLSNSMFINRLAQEISLELRF